MLRAILCARIQILIKTIYTHILYGKNGFNDNSEFRMVLKIKVRRSQTLRPGRAGRFHIVQA